MNEEEMIHYEDELFEELSKNKIKRTDILINLNVALQKYQRLVANIKDAREIQEYKIAVVSVESELKELQQENEQLKEQLETSEKARKEAIEFIKEYEKNQNLLKWNEEDYIDVINEIKKYLDIDKGE